MESSSINLDKVIEEIDKAVFAQEERCLTNPEKTILRGAAQNQSYEDMGKSSRLNSNTLRGDVGPKLWKLLTKVLGEKVNRRNFQEVLERHWGVPAREALYLQESLQPDADLGREEGIPLGASWAGSKGAVAPPLSLQKWSQAPDVSTFYGRDQELTNLKKWIVKEPYKLVAIVGMPGIGKTFLATKLARDLEEKGYNVIWRSLGNARPLKDLLDDLIKCLLQQPTLKLPEDVNDIISLLISYLQKYRALLVLDNWDTLLKEGDFASQYEEEYKDYGRFLRRLGEEVHQSCLVLTSRKKPKEIEILEGENPPVRSLELNGLKEEDAYSIMKARGLRDDEQEKARWDILIKVYKGNPLALELICPTIKEIFGSSVAAFISDTGSVSLRSFRAILDVHFARLSILEKKILFWLAIKQEYKGGTSYFESLGSEPNQMSVSELKELLETSELKLYEALLSLRGQSLIEKGDGTFSLQPVVWEFVRNQVIDQVCKEIQEASNNSNSEKLESNNSNSEKLEILKDKALSKLVFNSIKKRLDVDSSFRKESSFFSLDNLRETQSRLKIQTSKQPQFKYVEDNISNLIEVLQQISGK